MVDEIAANNGNDFFGSGISVTDPRTAQIKRLVKQAKAIGCPPDPNWGTKAGQQSAFTSGDTTRHDFVPATAGETSVPAPGSVWGFIDDLLGGVGDTGDILPAAR